MPVVVNRALRTSCPTSRSSRLQRTNALRAPALYSTTGLSVARGGRDTCCSVMVPQYGQSRHSSRTRWPQTSQAVDRNSRPPSSPSRSASRIQEARPTRPPAINGIVQPSAVVAVHPAKPCPAFATIRRPRSDTPTARPPNTAAPTLMTGLRDTCDLPRHDVMNAYARAGAMSVPRTALRRHVRDPGAPSWPRGSSS